ncbi:MBL fold metallo-hydrolase [Jannaschia pagri]|uniref:MBL fold metallo-hydrolase n=1 Tax=Jannaschia pagri TaxID=2829797 RepID=A0ABQ4NQP9_9RHOB|nr:MULTISPECIES: MBL fold metallo-hydrolase [unclassified Jannaschia]GIT92904.1 MBL fold metallo-hydrolase [Jannaschia sp. AI_61]GIT96739.1 MBL fold metallo-hydrolase [Jannaschia sp. AI_62]
MTMLSRRAFGLSLAAGGVVLGAAATPLFAQTSTALPPAVAGASLGAYRITAILDGIVPLGRPFFQGGEEVDAFLASEGLGPEALPAPISAFLLQSADRTILIDAGMGDVEAFGPGFGRLTAGLAALGVEASDVDTVILTHAHPDHLGGLVLAGVPAFPNAELVLSEAESAFWTDAAMQAAAPAEAQGLFQLAAGTLQAYGTRVTLVQDGAEVAPGVTLHVSPGHTPGHGILLIDGGDRQMMMIADTVHSADLHTALPETGFGFDVDTALAIQSRLRLFDEIASDKILVTGSHLHFPGFGRILPAGDAYRFVPATLG